MTGPRIDLDHRMAVWRDGHRRGLTTAEIAQQLHISVHTLYSNVTLARRHGHPDAVPRHGGAYRPSLDVEHRLQQWKAGCRRGLTTAEIAHQLRVTVATLQRSVYYARKRGHPDAVLHPLAVPAGQGINHTFKADARRRRTARQADGRGADSAHRGTLPETTDPDH